MAGNENSTQSVWVGKNRSKPESKMHRLVYQALSSLVIELVQAVLPLDKVPLIDCCLVHMSNFRGSFVFCLIILF